MCLNKYKHKYDISLYDIGKSPMSRNGIQNNVNDIYFNKLTLESCYYAGFIAADGNVDKTSIRLTIGLASKDEDWLCKFKTLIQSNAKISRYIYKKKYEISSVMITSKQICADLYKNFNITPRKSLTYTPPQFDNDNLKDAFIVGIIDGDGTIGMSKRKNQQDSLYISLIGTYETISFVKQRFEQILGHKISKPFFRNKNINTCTIRISDKSARLIFKHFYSINVPKLNRKWKNELYKYCNHYHKALPICRRKGVNVFDLNGNLLRHFDTLQDASQFCNVSMSAISRLCTNDNSHHMANGFMCSRVKTKMQPYIATNQFSIKRVNELNNE